MIINKPIRNCPFCGGQLIVHNFPWFDGTPGYEIWHVTNDDSIIGTGNKCPLKMSCYRTEEEAVEAADMRYDEHDYLKEIYDWALRNMEAQDEPEWSLFSGIVDAIEKYLHEKRMEENE